MPREESITVRAPGVVAVPAHLRVRRGIRKGRNWLELVKFCAVGGSGFVINLAVFAVAAQALGMHHLLAATCAFLVAVTNNFFWNRHWTFGAGDGHAGFQAARFLAVSVAAFVFQALLLDVLVTTGAEKLIAQAVSVAAATPLNFVGNKMWSFARGLRA